MAPSIRATLSSAAIFAAWLAALLVVAPILGMLLGLGPLFFMPQYVIGFSQMVRTDPSGYGFQRAIDDPYATYLMLAVRAGSCVIFGVATRRFRPAQVTMLAPITILALVLLVHLTFGIFGYAIQLDGP